MKKLKGTVLTFILGIMIAVGLTGCATPNDLYFEGNKLPQTQVEEILEDRLEDENGIEYEVNITEEVDD